MTSARACHTEIGLSTIDRPTLSCPRGPFGPCPPDLRHEKLGRTARRRRCSDLPFGSRGIRPAGARYGASDSGATDSNERIFCRSASAATKPTSEPRTHEK